MSWGCMSLSSEWVRNSLQLYEGSISHKFTEEKKSKSYMQHPPSVLAFLVSVVVFMSLISGFISSSESSYQGDLALLIFEIFFGIYHFNVLQVTRINK